MQTTTLIRPAAEDKPSGVMSGTARNIPVLYLDCDYGEIELHFRPTDLKAADDYLTKLVHAAQDLQEKVRLAMQEKAVGLR